MPNNFEEKNSIKLLFDEIEKALNAELYLIALMTVLTIPDVMSKIEYGNGSGKIPSSFEPKRTINNCRLFKKYMNNLMKNNDCK